MGLPGYDAWRLMGPEDELWGECESCGSTIDLEGINHCSEYRKTETGYLCEWCDKMGEGREKEAADDEQALG